MRQDAATHAFLGEEFLTWLWFHVDTAGGEFELDEGRSVAVAIDDYIAFAPRDDDETEQTLRKGLPTHSREARVALANGHRLRKAKLIVAEGPLQFGVTLDGTTLQLSAIKLPEDSEECGSVEERNVERAANFLALHALLGAVYERFLADRLRPEYLKTSAEQQAAWMSRLGG